MKITKLPKVLTIFILALYFSSNAQILTKEDSLSAGLTGRTNNYSVLSGYGEAKVNYDLGQKTGEANLTRSVMFFGHKFSNSIYFFSELELEHGRVASGTSGEIALEQLFLKFNVNPTNYFAAGLIIPRIGLTNENHLPTTFNGNDRPTVERLVIPSTWREMGVAYYGSSNKINGLNYSLALMNGLNSKNFAFGSGIRSGRMGGSKATASNIALTGALLYYIGNFRIQASSYYGGSAGIDQIMSDSLNLDNGAFGTPVNLNEANIRFSNKNFEWKALACIINIPDAEKINKAYKSNTPKAIFGGYIEGGIHILQALNKKNIKVLTLFSRLESIDLNYKIPPNAKKDNFQKQLISVSGITFAPVKGIVIKGEYTWRQTGNFTQELYATNPYKSLNPFKTEMSFVTLGIGYSF